MAEHARTDRQEAEIPSQVREHEDTPIPLDTIHLYLTEPFATVVSSILRERLRQVAKLEYTAEHDAQHTPEEWAQMIGKHYREALKIAKAGHLYLFRAELIQGAALYMAALEALALDLSGRGSASE